MPVIETPEHIAAAELATRELKAPYLTAIMEGRYRDSFLAAAGVNAPKVAAEDMGRAATSARPMPLPASSRCRSRPSIRR